MSKLTYADFENIFALSNDYLCVADPDGYFLWVNAVWEDLLGLPIEEILNRRYSEFIHPDDIASTEAELVKLSKGQRTVNFENRYRGKDGKIHWLLWNCTPKEDGTLYASARDITDYKEKQHLLEKKVVLSERLEKRLHNLNQLANEDFLTLEEAFQAHLESGTRILSMNTGLVSEINDDDYIIRSSLSTEYSFDSGMRFSLKDTLCSIVAETQKCQSYRDLDADTVMKSHPIHTVFGISSYIAAPILASGKLFGTLSFVNKAPRETEFEGYEYEYIRLMAVHLGRLVEKEHEFHQLKLKQEELFKQRQLFKSVFMHSPDAMLLANEKREISLVNPAMKRIFGYSPDELKGLKTTVIYESVEEFERQGQIRFNLSAEDKYKPYECRYKKKSGEVFPGETVGTILKDEEGAFLGFLGQIRDITHRKVLEKMKEQFLSTISHELRTPLTSIRGSLALLQEGVVGELTEEASKLASISSDNCNRLLSLINDILDFEKLQSQEAIYEMKSLSATKLARKAIDITQGFAAAYSITLNLEAPHEDFNIQGNKDRLLQVFSNLLSNAIKFSPDGSEVKIHISEEGENFVRFSVEDKGIGISEEFLPKLFDSFSQEDASDSKVVQGTGLGLSITKQIIMAHKGDISVETERGRGSIFHFDIPKTVREREYDSRARKYSIH